MSPAPSRRTRVRCSPSSRGSVTVSSPGSREGAKNRCTGRIIRCEVRGTRCEARGRAHASLTETDNHLQDALDCVYITQPEHSRLTLLAARASGALQSYLLRTPDHRRRAEPRATWATATSSPSNRTTARRTLAPSHLAPIELCYTARQHVFPRTDHREIQDPVDDRQRRLWHGLPRRGHLDRQEGRAQGAAQAGRRLRRAAARAAAARQPQSPEHRHDPDRGEAGERLLHRDGVRAGRDARDDHRARRRRSTWRGRSTTPARSATPSTTRTGRACCTATCGRPTCSSPTAAC